jgi:hypothetical protein
LAGFALVDLNIVVCLGERLFGGFGGDVCFWVVDVSDFCLADLF